ncbi:MAG: SIS domain-containing protein, partial [Jatrophihabitans sp.]|uniref:SIS domain-containing protein n=1 Tax=Jatrophihabitans sp. TaxID=1932789 RepID=UPI003F813EE3
LMRAEIAEQPAVLAAAVAECEQAREVGALLRRRPPRFVLLAARGTSDHAALYAKDLVEVEVGRPAGLASPSVWTVFGARPDLRGTLLLAVSQSGASPDLVDSVTAARESGALTVAVTNAPSSALAQAAHVHVDIGAGAEVAVAATKTYTAELVALYRLLVGDHGIDRLGDAAAATLAAGDVGAVAERYRFADRLVTTGRGWSYPTAREAALKLMETSYIAAQAFSGADLLHGPLAMIDGGVPVLALTGRGATAAAMSPVLERLRERGADVVRVGPGGDLPVVADALPEALAPVVEILPLQRLALRVATARGLDPDRPRALAKVTHTW